VNKSPQRLKMLVLSRILGWILGWILGPPKIKKLVNEKF
jgi:hypothetical protein